MHRPTPDPHPLIPQAMRYLAVLPLFLLAAPAAAQMSAPAPHAPPSVMSDVRDQWRGMSGYVVKSAEAVPEAQYAFRPVKGVRTFAELFTHVAGAQSMFCAMALGEKAPAEDAVKATSKAAIVDALKHSNADCERAYAQSDSSASASIDFYGSPRSRLYVLMLNATHDAEHYGNIITYMRMNGMVPPSSQPAK